MKKIKKYVPIIVVIIIVLVIVILGLIKFSDKPKDKKSLDLNKVGFNYNFQDSDGMMLYHRYQPEDGLLFSLIGSNSFDDYYAYYYKKDKLSSNGFSDFVKNVILLDDADYTKWNYDDKENCYKILLDDYKIIYNKLFSDDNLNVEFDNNFIDVISNDNEICAKEVNEFNYDKIIDTYLVNIAKLKDKIIIYERVAFVKITDKNIIFYNDYEMKNKVYTLNNDKVDRRFINNSDIVSNVLIEYQDDFPLYQYTYKKGVDTYYLESIER